MNQQQKTYLSKRIQEITLLKIQKYTNVVDKLPYINKLRSQNHVGFIKAIEFDKKALKVREDCFKDNCFPNDNSYRDVFKTPETLLFSNYDEVILSYEKAVEESDKKNEEKKKMIEKYSQKLQDKVMLGDADEALRQLSDFEKMQF